MQKMSSGFGSTKRAAGCGGNHRSHLSMADVVFLGFQVAVPPAQPAQHHQRHQAQLLAAEAAGPETAEAESCCHPSHCEYPAGEGQGWEHSLCLVHALPLGSVVCVRAARMCSSLGMASGPQRAVPGRCEPPSQARCSLCRSCSQLLEQLCQQHLDVS